MITDRRWFHITDLQAEHAKRLLGQLSLAHSLPTSSLIELAPWPIVLHKFKTVSYNLRRFWGA